MISEIYKNRMLYYNFMNDFLQKRINSWEFRKKYWSQRHEDLDREEKNGYTFEKYEEKIRNLSENAKKFKEQYCQLLHVEGISALKEYEKGAKDLNIIGELFFMGLWNYIDYPIKDYYPSDDEGFDPQFDIDEKTLTEIIQAVFDVLERNKNRWEYGQNESIKM